MKRKQFSEEQIIAILKEASAGAVVTELCRKHGMSCATYSRGTGSMSAWRCRTPSGASTGSGRTGLIQISRASLERRVNRRVSPESTRR